MKEDTKARTGASGGEPLKALKARLHECVRDLDRLELHHPAALVCMAIDRLDQTSDDPASFG
ncbi:hypothetical protein OF829_12850 [Sphingomonas sp. LB-2]|uniref:hypothetical protein n=1 Tax=Sphingomonas caeni TaxID=2984949 RepID=UPI00222ED08C|nr:hypothetical protein [Sphingomonas caeni]MCW3848131.1 hypothetical protein [Sphingomonas caeni]